MRLRTIIALSLMLSVTSPASSDAPPKGEWRQIDDDDGIKTWRLEIPNVEMPGFRGETVIAAPAERIADEIKHVEHHTEWMKNCSESKVVKKFDEDHVIVYNRTDTPWPVWDRDAILDTQFTTTADKITLTFKNTDPKLRPLPDGVIRMPRLEGSYEMWKLAPDKTRVRYTVEVDVGGSLPTWLAKRIAKEMPYETLNRLRARVTGKK